MRLISVAMHTMATDGTSPRRKSRILAAQLLYSWSINSCASFQTQGYVDEFISSYGDDEPKEFYKFARDLSIGTIENLDIIDQLIEKYTKNWTISRIAKVDLAILRVTTYEMLFREDIPPIVSMNEAIEVGRELSTEESNRFLNGVLDNIRAELNRPMRTPWTK